MYFKFSEALVQQKGYLQEQRPQEGDRESPEHKTCYLLLAGTELLLIL